MPSEASNSILDTTTTLYCRHHGDGNPSMLESLQGINSIEHRISKADDRVLRTKGISTIRKSGKDFDVRMPLRLNLLQYLCHKVFEIHCDEDCSMTDVLLALSRKYQGDSVIFIVNQLKPDDNYTMVHRELVTVQHGRVAVEKLSPFISQLSVSDKIRNRSRCLYSVQTMPRAA